MVRNLRQKAQQIRQTRKVSKMTDLKIIARFKNEKMRSDFMSEIVKWEQRCEIEREDDLAVTYKFSRYTTRERDCLLRTLDALIAYEILADYDLMMQPDTTRPFIRRLRPYDAAKF